ncbi:MAG: prolipoprotein diacylglyceryl transferase family protein, partial [Limisphaerales bacterium]
MHPVAIDLGGFTIYWYGVLVAVAFLAGLWTASRRAPLSGGSSERVADFGPWLILGAVAGARFL